MYQMPGRKKRTSLPTFCVTFTPFSRHNYAALETAMMFQLRNVAITVKYPKQAIEPFFSPSKMLRVSKTFAKNPFEV